MGCCHPLPPSCVISFCGRLDSIFPEDYPKSSSPDRVPVILLRKMVFADVIKLRISRQRHPGLLRWVLNSVTGVPIRERQREGRDVQTQRGKVHGKTEAEVGVMQPQAEERLEPPETGRGKETPSPKTSRRLCPYQHFDFRLVASKTIRKTSFCCFKAMQCVTMCHGIHGTL